MKNKFTIFAVLLLTIAMVVGCGSETGKKEPLPVEKQKNEIVNLAGDMNLEVADNAVVAKVNSNVPDGGVFELIANYDSDAGTKVESDVATIKDGKIVKEFVVPDFTGYVSVLAVLDFNAELQPEQIKTLGANRESLNIASDEIPYPSKDAVRKMAFAGWEKQYNQQSKMLDDALATWKNIMQGLANGSIGEYAAYDKLQSLDKQLNNVFSRDFTDDVWAIAELSKEQRDSLKDAFDDMFAAVGFRQQAVKSALKWLNDPTPSNAQKIKDNIDFADSCVLDGAAKVIEVKQELGLLE